MLQIIVGYAYAAWYEWQPWHPPELTWGDTLAMSQQPPRSHAVSSAPRDRGGKVLYIVNTHPASVPGRSLDAFCDDDSVLLCTDSSQPVETRMQVCDPIPCARARAQAPSTHPRIHPRIHPHSDFPSARAAMC